MYSLAGGKKGTEGSGISPERKERLERIVQAEFFRFLPSLNLLLLLSLGAGFENLDFSSTETSSVRHFFRSLSLSLSLFFFEVENSDFPPTSVRDFSLALFTGVLRSEGRRYKLIIIFRDTRKRDVSVLFARL